jgi:VanZ family protein
MTPQTTRRVLLAWLLVALCVALILTLSGEEFGAATTSSLLEPILRWIYPDITSRQRHDAHVLVRKAAHVAEYALLGLFALRALRLSLDLSAPRLVLLSLALVLVVAGIDELRQSFLPTRSGSAADVLLDVSGGLLGIGLLVFVHRRLGVGPPLPRAER